MIMYYLWSVAGNKVISRKLSAEDLSEVEAVLQRPLLVWDNLHANDYDSRRLFLGPFKGRDPELRSHLRGLLLNPNCEFEANYIPLHTLGSWHRAGCEDGQGDNHYLHKMFLLLKSALKNGFCFWFYLFNQRQCTSGD